MNSLYMILVIPMLVVLNGILGYFSQILYKRFYAKHIAIEPANLTQPSLTKIIAQTMSLLDNFSIAPLFLWAQGDSESSGFYMLCGYIIGYLAYSATRHFFSIIVFIYVKNNPTLVTGKVIFQFPAMRMILFASAIQQCIFLLILALFVPDPFIIGSALALLLTGIFVYFSKLAQPIV